MANAATTLRSKTKDYKESSPFLEGPDYYMVGQLCQGGKDALTHPPQG